MTALFIADLHLSPERPQVTRAFLDFLQDSASRADSLYILGDLFEAWVGDDDPSPLARQVISALGDLTKAGTSLYLQQGNRDFLIGRSFCRETGAVLLADEHVANVHGQRILLLHGDTLCTEDHAYQKFRKRVRHPIVKWVLTHLPLKKRLQMAADWRAQSRAHNSNKPDHIMDVTQQEVEHRMELNGVETMIHGHTHRPAEHSFSRNGVNCKRWVLGDWGEQGWALSVDKTGLTLKQWAIAA